MTNWKYKMKIKDCFVDDPDSLTEEQVNQIGQNIAERIKEFSKKLNSNSSLYLDLNDVSYAMNNAVTVDEIDCYLDDMYDICDSNRIWVE